MPAGIGEGVAGISMVAVVGVGVAGTADVEAQALISSDNSSIQLIIRNRFMIYAGSPFTSQ